MSDNVFQNGKIYKIVDNGNQLCYYGSTIRSLESRMAEHRAAYLAYKHRSARKPNTVVLIFDEYGIENTKIELVEVYPCASRTELLRREGEYIKNNTCVNRVVAGRTHTEYLSDFRAHLALKKKEWAERNKEEVVAYKKQYYQTNKDFVDAKNIKYKLDHEEEIKNYKKKYAEDHAEEAKQSKRNWYLRNKEKVLAKSKERWLQRKKEKEETET
jgi:hypothetical protein